MQSLEKNFCSKRELELQNRKKWLGEASTVFGMKFLSEESNRGLQLMPIGKVRVLVFRSPFQKFERI